MEAVRRPKVFNPSPRARSATSESSKGSAKCETRDSRPTSRAIPARQAMLLLKAGNERFVRGRPMAASFDHQARHQMEMFQSPHTAVVGCADCPVPLETIFDSMPGDIFALRNAGNTCTHAEGSMMGSLEFCCGALGSKLVVVLGHSQCGAIQAARSYEAGAEGILLELQKAVQEAAQLGAEEPLEEAVKVNVFRTMNYLLQSSRSIQSKVKAGQLELVGAIFDNKSGRVEFMGRSPLEASILSGPGLRAPAETGVSPAYAMQLLQEGNARYALGTRNGGLTTAKATYAAVVSCSDCKLAVEELFDAMASELFCLKTTANLFSAALLGSLEFCCHKLNAAVILVLGHTQCEALSTCQRIMSQTSPQESLGGGLDGIMSDLSVMLRGRCGCASHVAKLTVFDTMEKILRESPLLQELVRNGKLEVQGGIFDETTGCVEFLGHLPNLENLFREPLRRGFSHVSSDAALQLLREGNERWVKGTARSSRTFHSLRDDGRAPFCAVIGCADLRTPVERIFDSSPGEIFVLRNAGNTITHAQGSVVTSLEFCTGWLNTQLILVLGHTTCLALSRAIASDSSGGKASDALVAGIRLAAKANPEEISMEEVAEANVRHTMSCLLQYSARIREKVRSGELALQGAVYVCATGQVRFLDGSLNQDLLCGG